MYTGYFRFINGGVMPFEGETPSVGEYVTVESGMRKGKYVVSRVERPYKTSNYDDRLSPLTSIVSLMDA